MVSQRSMHRTLASLPWLLGLAVVLWLAPGCGQDEGDRCQVVSDCASGLVCLGGETGNGICRRPGAIGNNDAAPDLPASGPEAEPPTPDVAPESTDLAAPAVDTQPAADAALDAPSPADAQSASFDLGSAQDAPRAIDVAPVLDVAPAVDVKAAIDGGATNTTAG